jgi:hypothetical protein
MQKNTALVSFLYPAARNFFGAFVANLNAQTTKQFTIVLFNDGVVNPERWLSLLKVPYLIFPANASTPMSIRFEAMEKLRTLDFEYLIFQDSDDGLSSMRVEVVTKLLRCFPMVVNDLDIIDKDGQILEKKIWEKRFEIQPTFNFSDLVNFNFVGLGNTAIHAELLKALPIQPAEEIVAVDWYLFYALLYVTKTTGYRTSACTTLYRQHSRNSIGQMTNDKKSVARQVKNMHIAALRAAKIPGIEVKSQTEEPLFQKDKCTHPFWWEITN